MLGNIICKCENIIIIYKQQILTLNWASKSACPSMIPISSFNRSGGAFSPNILKLFKKSINILNSAPVTSSKLWNKLNNVTCSSSTRAIKLNLSCTTQNRLMAKGEKSFR